MCSWVLTAGHCLLNETLTVHYGMSRNGVYTESMEIPTSNQFHHPQYLQQRPEDPHDIGLKVINILSDDYP